MRLWGLPLDGHGETGLYTLCRWLAVPIFGGLYRARAKGTGNIPYSGPAIVITNHKANIDPVICGMVFDRPLRYMAKKELFGNAALRTGELVELFVLGTAVVPIPGAPVAPRPQLVRLANDPPRPAREGGEE